MPESCLESKWEAIKAECLRIEKKAAEECEEWETYLVDHIRAVFGTTVEDDSFKGATLTTVKEDIDSVHAHLEEVNSDAAAHTPEKGDVTSNGEEEASESKEEKEFASAAEIKAKEEAFEKEKANLQSEDVYKQAASPTVTVEGTKE